MPKYKPNKASNTNKGIAWLYNEVCALLDVWSDHDIQQQLSGRLHNMCVYEKISNRLKTLGVDRTAEQCREKIKKLKRDYKIVKDNNYSPAFARKLLGCFDKVNEVFGKCAVLKPSSVVESLAVAEGKFDEEGADDSRHNASVYSDDDDDSRDSDAHSDDMPMDYAEDPLIWEAVADPNVKRIFEASTRSRKDCFTKICTTEKRRLERQLERERFRLQTMQKRRHQDRQRELNMFQMLYSMIALKQKGITAQCNGNIIYID